MFSTMMQKRVVFIVMGGFVMIGDGYDIWFFWDGVTSNDYEF